MIRLKGDEEMSYNDRRYNNLGDVPDMNIYKPDNNIKSCAYHIRPIINQAYAPTGDPDRPYAWMKLNEEWPVGSGNIYSDDAGDLIGKVAAGYNGGNGIFGDLMQHAWDVVSQPSYPGLTTTQKNYGKSVKERLGIR